MITFIDILNNDNVLSPKTFVDISEADLQELKGAFCTRGKRKGLLKKSAPKQGTVGAIGWQACMMNVAPVRVGIYSTLLLTNEEIETYKRIEKFCDENRIILNMTGQRPLEFNLMAFRYDFEAIQDTYKDLGVQK